MPKAYKNNLFYSFALLIHKAKSFYCFHKQIIKEPVNYNYNPIINLSLIKEEPLKHSPFREYLIRYIKVSPFHITQLLRGRGVSGPFTSSLLNYEANASHYSQYDNCNADCWFSYECVIQLTLLVIKVQHDNN